MSNSRNAKRPHALSIGHCADGESCAGERAGLPKRHSFGLTQPEEVTLEVVRMLLSTYLTADARYWDGAIEFAEMNLGSEEGTRLVTLATSFVRALRHDRTTPFNFLTFGCQHISDDELSMVSALQAARLGPESEFDEAMRELANSNVHARLKNTVAALGRALDEKPQPTAQTAFAGVRIAPGEALH